MKTIEDFSLKGKTVIIRCDLNVPIKDGIILDDNRIKESTKTIKYAIRKGAKIIVLSHLGRVKKEEDLQKNDLLPVSKALSKALKHKVTFIPKTRGKEVENAIKSMKNKDVILLQNTRFEDLKGKKESSNDKRLGKYWASLADIYINDAFGTSHRSHASNVGIASNLKGNSGIGYLVQKELKNLTKAVNPKEPFVVVMGGAKISDKIEIIESLIKKADYLLIGGAMAFTFLKASGFKVGKSLVDEESLEFASVMLNNYPDKIVLPIDIITSNEKEIKQRFINEIKNDECGYDIGPKTLEVFTQYLEDAKTIFWNGPVGMFETKEFENGTKKLCEIISKTKATTIIGGGDTASAVINLGYKDKFSHISTGGGASLEFIAYEKLPAIEVIECE